LTTLSRLLSSSRRSLLKGVAILALAGLYLAYVVPQFVSLAGEVMGYEPIGPQWPPAMREQIKRERRMAWQDFYLLIAAVVVGLLLLVWGIRCIQSYTRRPPKPRGEPRPSRR